MSEWFARVLHIMTGGGGTGLEFTTLKKRVGVAYAVCLLYKEGVPDEVAQELTLDEWLSVYWQAKSGTPIQSAAHAKVLESVDTYEQCHKAFTATPSGSALKSALLVELFRKSTTFSQWRRTAVAMVNDNDAGKAAAARYHALELVDTFACGLDFLTDLPTNRLYTDVFAKTLDFASTYEQCFALLNETAPQDEDAWAAAFKKVLEFAATYEQCMKVFAKAPSTGGIRGAALDKAFVLAATYQQYLTLLPFTTGQSALRAMVLREARRHASTFSECWELRMYTSGEAGEDHRRVVGKAFRYATTLKEMLFVHGAAVYFPVLQQKALKRALSVVGTVKQGVDVYCLLWVKAHCNQDCSTDQLDVVFERLSIVAKTMEDWAVVLDSVQGNFQHREQAFSALQALVDAYDGAVES